MSDSQQLLAVVDSLYESALDPTQWSKAMHSLADFAGASGTFYLIADQAKNCIVYSETEGIDPSANEAYLKYYATKDMRLGPAHKFPVGQAVTEDMLVDWRAFRKSELFVDLLTPHDIPRILGFWVTKNAANASAFVLERSRGQGPFQRHEIARCAQITPHVVRAIRTREALASARQRERIYVDLLSRLPFATILLNADLGILEVSPAAQTLLKQGDALRSQSGRVRAAMTVDDSRLQVILARTVATTRELGGGSLRVRRNTRPSISISIVPIPSPDIFVDVRPAVMLLISDPLLVPRQPTAMLRDALQLTEAEALLANKLFAGATLKHAAEDLHISVNTCKSQLKSIYAKTGCRSHADLVRSVFAAALASAAPDAFGIDGRD